jgi:hypothetical protein
MHDFEGVRMCALERGELLMEQDVPFGHVRVEQCESRSVHGVVEGMVEELVQWRDARSSADQRHVLKLVRCSPTQKEETDDRRGRLA